MSNFLSRVWYILETCLYVVAILATVAGAIYAGVCLVSTINGDRTYRDEYTETCSKVGGTVVYTGRQLECLK